MTFIILGLGAIGSNLFMELVNIDSRAKFIGIDFDKVEDRNIKTQAYFLHHIGMFKAQAMQVVIGMKHNNIQYFPIVKKIQGKNDINNYINKKNVLIIDCFDNSQSRKLLEGIDNCLHIGFSPQYTAEIIWGENYTTPNDIPEDQNDICDMDQAVPFISFVIGLAGLVIKKYIDQDKKNSFVVFDKYKIREL
jgi:hypothetical protein